MVAMSRSREDETLDESPRRAGRRAHRLGPGQTIEHRYRVVEVLGAGGMGTVYRARDEQANREVALKVLASVAGISHERFAREGALTASLSHPGIMRVHSHGNLPDGSPYLVYELIEGARTLDEILPEQSLRGRIELLLEAAEALAFAHEHGVVHRDVKPENLLVDTEGRLRVADFGLAAAAGLERLTQTSAFVGTPLYMSPEQARGMSPIPQMDVWSLGVVLFEALSDALPFAGTTVVELMGQLMTLSAAPSPRALKADVPKGLDAICGRALAPDLALRYPSARELANDLRAWLGGDLRVSGRGWRRPRLLLGVPAVAVVAFVAVAVLGERGSSREPSTPGSTPAATVERATRPRETDAAGQARWREVRALSDEAEQLRGLGEWLSAFPGHPLRSRVAARQKRLAARVPRWHRQFTGLVGARYLDARRVILWSRKPGEVAVWTPGTEALDSWRRELISALSVSAEAVAIATLTDLHVRRLDGTPIFSHAHGPKGSTGRPVRSLAFSSDNSLLAAGGSLADVRVYNARSGELRASFPRGKAYVAGVAFIEGGRSLAILHSGRTPMDIANQVTVVTLDGGPSRTISLSSKPIVIAPLPGSGALIGYSHGGFERLELTQGEPRATSASILGTQQHRGRVTDFWVGAEGIVSVAGAGGSRERALTTGERQRNDVRVWTAGGERLLGQGLATHAPLLSVELGPAGLLLAVSGTDHAQIWHPDAVPGLSALWESEEGR